MKKSELRSLIREVIKESKIKAFGKDKATLEDWSETFDNQEAFETWLADNADNYNIFGTEFVK